MTWSKLRVLQVVDRPQRRGGEVFAAQLSDALRARGHDVTTCYLHDHAGEARLGVRGIDRVLGGNPGHPLERLGAQPALVSGLRRVIREVAPDVVQVNGGRTVKYGALIRAVSRSRWKLVYRNIGRSSDWVRGVRRRVLYRGVMAAIDGIVTVSRHGAEDLGRLHGRLTCPVTWIPNAIALPVVDPGRVSALRRTLGLDADDRLVVTVASVSPEKRPDLWLRVVQHVAARSSATFLWVGDGPQLAALEARARSAGLARRARFFGVTNDVATCLGAADLFLLTSDTEGLPAALLEAGAVGLPVVSTNVGGIPDCVEDGVTGLLRPAGDELALAEAVESLLSTPERMRAMGHRGQERVTAEFSIEAAAVRYEAFYAALLR